MDDVRKSLSKLKKGFKHRLGGKERASNSAGANAAGEGDSSPASSLPPDPRVAVSGHDGGSKIGAGVLQARSRDPSSHPEPVPADEGRLDDIRRVEVDMDEEGIIWDRSNLDPGVEGAAGSGPSQEIKQASSPLCVTSIPREQEPNGMRTLPPRLLYLIAPLEDADTSAVRDRAPHQVRLDENAEPGAAANKKAPSWKAIALATAKLLLRGVRDSADAFGPLKSVAGGLCFILENCEVWSSPHVHHRILMGALANEGERANN